MREHTIVTGAGPDGAVAGCDRFVRRILTVRGKSVMVDRDLAELYKVPTKRLNEQVKRNAERFPERFMFRLNAEEMKELVANCDRFASMSINCLGRRVTTYTTRDPREIEKVLAEV